MHSLVWSWLKKKTRNNKFKIKLVILWNPASHFSISSLEILGDRTGHVPSQLCWLELDIKFTCLENYCRIEWLRISCYLSNEIPYYDNTIILNASSTRTPRKRSKSREISENTKLYFCIFRQGRKSKSNDAHHLLLTWSATKGGVPMRIELKSLWRSHLPIGPSLSGKYKKKNSWTFPSEIFGIHGANFLKTPAGTSGRYNYHTTTMQKDRWRSISDVKSSKKNHRPRPQNKKKSYRRDYRDLTYRGCYIFFVIIFRFTDIFLTGFLLPLQ